MPWTTNAFRPKDRTLDNRNNIKASFVVSGFIFLNLDKVLKSILALLAELAILRVDKVKVKSSQDVKPQTLVTLVSALAFISLQNLFT